MLWEAAWCGRCAEETGTWTARSAPLLCYRPCMCCVGQQQAGEAQEVLTEGHVKGRNHDE